MNIEWERFEAAFAAWKLARKKYDDAMMLILNRMPTDNLDVDGLIEEMDKTKKQLDEAAKPLIRPRP